MTAVSGGGGQVPGDVVARIAKVLEEQAASFDEASSHYRKEWSGRAAARLTVCDRCGAVVGDPTKHQAWHGWLSEQIEYVAKTILGLP